MAFIPAPIGVARVRLTWAMDGGARAQNVFYIDTGIVAHPLTPTEVHEVVSTVDDAINTEASGGNTFISCLSHDCVLREIHVEDAHIADGNFESATVSDAGSIGTASLPPSSAAVLTLNTGVRGRSNRGRMFVPGVPEGKVDASGTIADDQLGLLINGAASLLAGLASTAHNASQVGLLVVSFFHQVVPGTPPTVARAEGVQRVVNFIDVRSHIHSQRRRNLVG